MNRGLGGVALVPRSSGNAHLSLFFFFFQGHREERVLLLEREKKGLHRGLCCSSSAQKANRIPSLMPCRTQ